MPTKSLRQRISELTAAVRMSNKTVDTHRIQTKISTWIIMACSLVGGLIALQTYRLDVSKDVDEQVAKAFEMIMFYNGEELSPSRRDVRSYVLARRECDSRIISRDLSDDDFLQMIEFYDLIDHCVRADLCDGEVTSAFFSRHANFDWPVLTRVAEQMRESSLALKADTGFGRGYETFAATPVEAPPCDGNF